MHEKQFYVYILTNKPFGVLYIGVTSDLIKRIHQHKTKAAEGFSKQYNLDKLVYYEIAPTAEIAITREKNLKRWPREWKINVINESNSDWRDLYESLIA